jgi:hypothetical protein
MIELTDEQIAAAQAADPIFAARRWPAASTKACRRPP